MCRSRNNERFFLGITNYDERSRQVILDIHFDVSVCKQKTITATMEFHFCQLVCWNWFIQSTNICLKHEKLNTSCNEIEGLSVHHGTISQVSPELFVIAHNIPLTEAYFQIK